MKLKTKNLFSLHKKPAITVAKKPASSLDTLIKKCGHLIREKKFDDVPILLKQNYATQKSNPEFLAVAANYTAKAGDFPSSISYFTELLRFKPNDPDVLFSYTNILTKVKQGEKALPYYEQALEKEPKNRKLLTSYFHALTKIKRISEANKVASKIISLGSEKETLFYQKSSVSIYKAKNKDKSISIDPVVLWDIGDYLEKHPQELLKIPAVRARLSRYRRAKLFEEGKLKLKTEDTNIIQNAVVHNLETMEGGADDGGRISLLTGPLTGIDYVASNIANMKVLTIGPRSESEIFTLMAAGFKLDNITGIDLISYSPLIDHGDMHSLPYPNNSFDIIIAGWVLAYSKNNDLAAKEILRVCKPHGYIAAGSAYTPPSRGTPKEITGTNIIGTRFSSTKDFTKNFDHGIERVVFSGDVERDRTEGTAAVSIIMQKKGN
ncbi:MAG: methyltransferase domain-containing protein [Rickettsiales bacterium]